MWPYAELPDPAQLLPLRIERGIKAIAHHDGQRNRHTRENRPGLERCRDDGSEHLSLLAGTNRSFDPHFTIVWLYAGTSALDNTYYNSSEMAALAAKAAEHDSSRRAALYGRILVTLRADAPVSWGPLLEDVYAQRPGVTW